MSIRCTREASQTVQTNMANENEFEKCLNEVLNSLKHSGLDFVLKKEQREGVEQLYRRNDLLAVLPTGYGKSLIFQLLILMAQRNDSETKPVVIVVTPLVSIIQDQIVEIESMGLKGFNLCDALDKFDALEAVDIIYASAESVIDERFLSFLKKKKSFCQRVIAFVVDESHTVETWSGLREAGRVDESKSAKQRLKQSTAFRSAFGKLSILRSFFTQGTGFAALTGTADTQTQKIICSKLSLNEPLTISVSPNRDNVRFCVIEEKKENVFTRLDWLIENVEQKGHLAEKTLIFCNTMNDIACVVNYILLKLGNKAFSPTDSRDNCNCLIGIYHSSSWPHTKETIINSLKGNGKARVVVASSALSMGVNFPDIRYVINWGPARNILDHHQEAGRAGRDGKQSHNIIIFHGQQLSHCENDVKEFVRAKGCLRVAGYQPFDSSIKPSTPGHLCCSFCSLNCDCGSEIPCKYSPVYEQHQGSQLKIVHSLTRPINEQDKEDLKDALVELRQELNSASVLFDPVISHGFSMQLVDDIVNHCAHIFTLNDIIESCSIYSISHALKILEIIQEVFLDIPNFDATLNVLSQDIDNLLPCENALNMMDEVNLLDVLPDDVFGDDLEELKESLPWDL